MAQTAVDAPVFAAAVLPDHPGCEAARETILRVQLGLHDLALPASTIPAVVQLLERATGDLGWSLARGGDVSRMGALLDLAQDDIELGLELVGRYPEAGIRVAVLTATLMRHRVGEIISADARFDRLPGVIRAAPGEGS